MSLILTCCVRLEHIYSSAEIVTARHVETITEWYGSSRYLRHKLMPQKLRHAYFAEIWCRHEYLALPPSISLLSKP